MLDSHIFDELLKNGSMLDRLRSAAESGAVRVYVTHIQVDEILDTPDPEKRKLLIHTLMQSGAQEVSTHGFIPGASRVGLARLTSAESEARIMAYQAGNPAHLQDALIAETAHEYRLPLVTHERRRSKYTRAFPGILLWTLADLDQAMA